MPWVRRGEGVHDGNVGSNVLPILPVCKKQIGWATSSMDGHFCQNAEAGRYTNVLNCFADVMVSGPQAGLLTAYDVVSEEIQGVSTM